MSGAFGAVGGAGIAAMAGRQAAGDAVEGAVENVAHTAAGGQPLTPANMIRTAAEDATARLFYRQVRFENIDRFDYSLVFIRLLEELQYRRFNVQDIELDDPDWKDAAQGFRNLLPLTPIMLVQA